MSRSWNQARRAVGESIKDGPVAAKPQRQSKLQPFCFADIDAQAGSQIDDQARAVNADDFGRGRRQFIGGDRGECRVGGELGAGAEGSTDLCAQAMAPRG